MIGILAQISAQLHANFRNPLGINFLYIYIFQYMNEEAGNEF